MRGLSRLSCLLCWGKRALLSQPALMLVGPQHVKRMTRGGRAPVTGDMHSLLVFGRGACVLCLCFFCLCLVMVLVFVCLCLVVVLVYLCLCLVVVLVFVCLCLVVVRGPSPKVTLRLPLPAFAAVGRPSGSATAAESKRGKRRSPLLAAHSAQLRATVLMRRLRGGRVARPAGMRTVTRLSMGEWGALDRKQPSHAGCRVMPSKARAWWKPPQLSRPQ